MKRNQSIELLKLIAIFFIVIIHSSFASYFGFAMDAIARFAVPIFFMITGYFIIEPGSTSAKLKKQIIKLTKYYILYEVIYIAYYFIIALIENNLQSFEYIFMTNLKYILISPTLGFHLWYLINIIWVLIIIYLFNHFNKLKVLFIISLSLHLIGLFISHLSLQLFHRPLALYVTRNFLFFGLFYVLLGSCFKKVDIQKIKVSNKILLVFSIFACFSQVIEKYLWLKLFNSHFGDYFITTLLASLLIFVYALKINVNNRTIEKISSYSMPIYFLHPLVMSLLSLLSSYIIHINIDVIRSTLVGNLAFIIIVCILSCSLYHLSKRLLNTKIKF